MFTSLLHQKIVTSKIVQLTRTTSKSPTRPWKEESNFQLLTIFASSLNRSSVCEKPHCSR